MTVLQTSKNRYTPGRHTGVGQDIKFHRRETN